MWASRIITCPCKLLFPFTFSPSIHKTCSAALPSFSSHSPRPRSGDCFVSGANPKKNIFPIGRCSTLSPSHVIPPSTPHRIRAKTENRRRRRRRRRRHRRIDKTFDDGGICATRTPAAAAPTNTRQSRFSVQIFLHNLQNNRRRVQQNSTPARRMFQDDTNPPELLQLLEIQKKKKIFSFKTKTSAHPTENVSPRNTKPLMRI